MSVDTSFETLLAQLRAKRGPVTARVLRNHSVSADGNSDTFTGFELANVLRAIADITKVSGSGTMALFVDHSAGGTNWKTLLTFDATTVTARKIEAASVRCHDNIRVRWDITGGATWKVSLSVTASADVPVTPAGAVTLFSFADAESTDDAIGVNGDYAILDADFSIIKKTAGSWT